MQKIKAKDVCIVIPIYKDNKTKLLEQYEIESIENTILLMHKYDIYFIYDIDLNISFYEKYKSNNVKFKYFNFKNVQQYSNLCLNYKFYESFNSYKYMLICQQDAWIFKDKLLYWCNKGYDYCGSLIIFKNEIYENLNEKVTHNDIGVNIFDYDTVAFNGGFSLRNIESFYNVCYKYKDRLKNEYSLEDIYISFNLKNDLKIISVVDAIKFSANSQVRSVYPKLYCDFPFGAHTNWAKETLYEIFHIDKNINKIKYKKSLKYKIRKILKLNTYIYD